jgi:hypothetical protein
MTSGYLSGLLVDVIHNNTEGYRIKEQRNESNTGVLVHLKIIYFTHL